MHQAGEGRIPEQAALFEQVSVLPAEQPGVDRMLRLPGLDHEPSVPSPAAAPAAELLQQLEGPFVSPEILLSHQAVRLEDRDEREPVEVEAFRDDLRAHEDVHLAPGEAADDGSLHAFGSVAVQSLDTVSGEQGAEFLLDPLRAGPKRLERSAAGRTGSRKRLGMTAIMADQPVRLAVKAQGNMAVPAAGDGSAFGALDGRGVGAAGAQDEDLLPAAERFGDFRDQFPGKRTRHAPFAAFRHRVDHPDRRIPAAVVPLQQVHLDETARGSVVQRFQRGGRAAQQHVGALDDPEHDGRFPAVVPGGRCILLVGQVMFLVHDDEPQVVVGKEQGGTGAQDKAGALLPDPGGGMGAAGGGFAGMEYLHVGEEGGDAVFQLPGKGDFGNEVQDAPSFPEGLPCEGQVNLGLSGSGDAVQQDGLPGGEGAADLRGGRFLGGRQAGKSGGRRRGGFFSPQTRLQDRDGRAVAVAGIVPAGPLQFVPERFQPAFEPFPFPCLRFFPVQFQGRVGGLVHLARGAEIVAGDGLPEPDFFGKHRGKPIFGGQDGLDPRLVRFRDDVQGGDHADIVLSGEGNPHAAAHFHVHSFRKGIAGIPLQPERKDDRYEAFLRHGRAGFKGTKMSPETQQFVRLWEIIAIFTQQYYILI